MDNANGATVNLAATQGEGSNAIVIALEEAAAALDGPRIKALVTAAEETLDHWNERYGSGEGVLEEATRSSVFADWWYRYASGHLRDDVGVSLGDDQRQRFFSVESPAAQVLIRIKHLPERVYLSRNYRTRHAREWNAQIPMPGIPQCARLEFGYRLDNTGTRLKMACVLLRVENRVIWIWQVLGERVNPFAADVALDAADRDIIRRQYRYDNLRREVPT